MADPKRLLIVEDSPTCREYLRHILERDGGFRVVGTAADGEEAVRMALLLKPDVITMDLHLPRMSGIEASRKILEVLPVPIVVVSDLWETREVQRAFEAMEIGAVAGVQKPAGIGHPDREASARRLVRTVQLMAELPVVRRLPKTPAPPKKSSAESRRNASPLRCPLSVVAIGASTGGPPVLKEILSHLPASFPAPVVIVQHISPGFLDGMLEWLQRTSALRLRVPVPGEKLEPGTVFFAPDGLHMELEPAGTVRLIDGPPQHGVKPSVSVLFGSVAASYGATAAAVLLTGMGKDGARELGLLREKGSLTVAQNEESCVVFGMPGEAVQRGAAEWVLAPHDIARILLDVAGMQGQEGRMR